jgi:competence protein ComEC
LRLLILGFVLGAAWLQVRPELPELRWFWLLPPLAAAYPLLPSGTGGRALRRILLLGLALSAGFLYAAWRADMRLAEALPVAWEGRDVSLLGRVVGLPEPTPRGVRFVFQATQTGAIPQRLQLNAYVREGELPIVLAGGDCLRVSARLFRPHGSLNPGGFDYEGWLLERGIRATGYLTRPPLPAEACPGEGRALLDRTRDTIRQRLAAALGDAEHAGVVIALAVGDQNAIPDAEWTLFRTTGVTHLMSISGLHVTLLASLVFLVVQWGWRRVPVLAMRLPARIVAAGAGLVTAVVYVALAGFGIPAQRTLYMLAGVALSLAGGRLHSPSRILAAALAVVVLIDPWAALSPGFWLSFGAVAALFYAGVGRLRQPSLWLAWVQTQWAVSLALLPALLLIFHEVSLVSPLANAFAIPMVSLLAVPLVLAGVLLGWDLPVHLAHGVIELTLAGLQGLARLPQPVFHAAMPGTAAILLALAGVAVLLLPRGIPGRWLGALLLLPLLFPRLDKPAPGEIWLAMLDVGQGQAVLLQTARHALLYDAGPRYASGDDAGRHIVAPYLHAHGLSRLDGLVVSHDDIDHSGGALYLLESHTPAWLLSPIAGQVVPPVSETGRAILAAAPFARPCVAGQAWAWDGVRFQVLHPPRRHYANANFPDNDRSCVIRVVGTHGRVLLTGDMARLAELSLLAEYPAEALRAEVMLVPHHGSASSSMPEIVAAVAPEHALISVGRRNPFGHPAPESMARYKDAGARLWRTDRAGALAARIDRRGIHIATARQAQRRYWHGR